MAKWWSSQQGLKSETSFMLIFEKNTKEFVRWPENYKYEPRSLKTMINFTVYPQRMIQLSFFKCKWEYQIYVIYFMVGETEAQNGEEMFKITHLVTVRARIRSPQTPEAQSKVLLPQHLWVQGASVLRKEESFPRILEMTIQLQSDPLWRPLRSLAETFLVPLQAKFSSSYSQELTT